MLPLKLLALCSFIASGFQSINGQQFANAPQRTTSRPSSPTSTKGLREEEVERQILDQILRGKYDTNIRPSGIDAVNSETKVRVNLMLNSVSKIDDFNMEYRVQLTLRMEWNDSRLSYYNLNRTQNMKYLTIQDMKRVWIPDIYFINEKEAHFHSIIKPNFFIRIHPKGEVQFSCRLSLTLSCPMKLQLFPMDTQQCSILMSSYAWTIEDLDFNWRENDPVQLPDLSLPRFSLRETKTSVCDSVTVTGVYSCIKVDFTLDRNFSFYLTQMYIPCVMLVIVSWVSFWLDENAVPARTALGITTLLTMATHQANMNKNLPPVSYIKALDIWSGTCLLFIFAALLEYAVVNYVIRLDKRNKANAGRSVPELEQRPCASCTCTCPSWKHASTSKKVDVISRFLFPVLFVIFNLVYWLVYLVILP